MHALPWGRISACGRANALWQGRCTNATAATGGRTADSPYAEHGKETLS